MGIAGLPDWLSKPLAICLIDLLLAGDNALVIALVCRTLPPRRRQAVLLFGTVAAIALRVALAGLAGTILTLPGLKLAGGGMLAVLALNLAHPAPRRMSASPEFDERGDIVAAVFLVTLVDVLMSLDNVLALAAVAGDDLLYLAIGLLLSVSIVMFGSGLVAHLLDRFPDLARFGAALLGWVAGQMTISDTLVRDWVTTQAPALPLLVPVLAGVYVYLMGRDVPARTPARDVVASPSIPRSSPRPERIATAPASPPRRAHVQATESGDPERFLLIGLVALFVVAGLLLGLATLLGGGVLH